MGGRRPACFVTQQQQVSSWCCNSWQHERSTCPTCCRCVAWHRRQSLDHGGEGKEQPRLLRSAGWGAPHQEEPQCKPPVCPPKAQM